MKGDVLLRCDDSIYGVQIPLMLLEDKSEFAAINDCSYK